ncbi:hypothetical protein [Halanaerobacter jeridensis]|uniref:Uncharacterized protein n=1 Tax=Halanaerobacter jeridensis TaxID=706427 RepID=A0A938XUH1_9FIRM|nr:hypothetical protein [Halanaerobacter jeridensis]MBM7557778.1 hypothetical protein [Halanaerobacter jeridensis]
MSSPKATDSTCKEIISTLEMLTQNLADNVKNAQQIQLKVKDRNNTNTTIPIMQLDSFSQFVFYIKQTISSTKKIISTIKEIEEVHRLFLVDVLIICETLEPFFEIVAQIMKKVSFHNSERSNFSSITIDSDEKQEPLVTTQQLTFIKTFQQSVAHLADKKILTKEYTDKLELLIKRYNEEKLNENFSLDYKK